MPQWSLDLSQLPRSTRQRVHELQENSRAVAMAQARIRQAAIAKFYRNNRPRSVDGLGAATLSLDPYWWKHYMHANRLAPGEDKDLAKWLLKRRPEWCAVRATGTRMQVGYGSTPTLTLTPPRNGGVRFSKTYA